MPALHHFPRALTPYSLRCIPIIAQVRQLASAAALDGTVDAAAAKWVRHQKTTLIELQRRAAEKAQQIFGKQVRWMLSCVLEGVVGRSAWQAGRVVPPSQMRFGRVTIVGC